MQVNILYFIFSLLLGLIVGSFLNVCIYRLPRGESIVFPASHCPHCQHKLRFWDLIPLFSFFLLKGCCRYCQKQFAWRYPLVELITSILFALVLLFYPFSANIFAFVFYLLLVSLLVIIFFIDLENQVIPDELTWLGILAGLAFHFILAIQQPVVRGLNPFLESLFGLILGFLILWLVAQIGKLIYKSEVLGEGDLFLAAMLGSYFGLSGVVLSLFLAYLIAGFFAGILLLLKKVKMSDYVPFGPALVLGGIVTLFWGKQILDWYINLLI